MKKYKLKKDLPLAKAGTVVQVDLGKDSPRIYENKERNFKIIGVVDRATMEEWLEEIPEKPKSVFDLEIGDTYYSITSGGICISIETNHIEDTYGLEKYKNRLLHNNAFSTEEEARKELNKIIAIQKIKKYCWENGIKLADKEFFVNKNNNKIYIVYDTILQGFHFVFSNIYFYDNFLAFKDTEDAKQVIKDCESDLKIIFDIE